MPVISSAGIADLVFSPALLFLVGTVVGTVNVMAGGGSALTLPILIFLGLDSSEANGTNRFSILLQNVSASASFSHERAGNLPESLKYSLFTIPGAVCGAVAAVAVDDLLFQKIVGVVIIGVAMSIFSPLSKSAGSATVSGRKWLAYPGLVAVGFYGGFIQVGIGLVIMALLFRTVGGSAASVNAHKIFIVMIYTVPALGIFFLSGDVDILKGLNLAAGSMLGGWWAAKISVRKGVGAVRYFLVFAVVLSALKLFGAF